MSIHDVFKTDSNRLTKLRELDEGTDGLWQPSELAAIWQHQLDASLELDLTSRIKEPTTTYAAAASTVEKPPKTFRELLQHPSPSLELLRLAKEFAKTHDHGKESALPQEIATTLYYACIAAALVRLGQLITSLDITSLDKDQVRKGLKWGAARLWIDDSTRVLFEEGFRKLT